MRGDTNINKPHYICQYVSQPNSNGSSLTLIHWDKLERMSLVETVTAQPCKEATYVQTCWDEHMLYIKFHCEDHYVYSQYKNHDDPLYNQDVVEVFIDEQQLGRRYIELEVSPNNVVFDAIIENNGQGKIIATDLAWNIEGLITEVIREETTIDYYIGIPSSTFESSLVLGKQFNVNFYRIDEDEAGNREFQAWSPTGAINYHLSQYFRTLILQ